MWRALLFEVEGKQDRLVTAVHGEGETIMAATNFHLCRHENAHLQDATASLPASERGTAGRDDAGIERRTGEMEFFTQV
jgi:hypothetical protein